jgi:serine/threonine protein kinase
MATGERAGVKADHHPDDLVGQRLGVYQLTGLLGRAGVSSVYRAEDVLLGRPVAVKVLPAWSVESDRQRLDRFLHEARAAAQLQHPNVVTIHYVGQQADHHFVVMEYMAGGSLQDLLDRGERLSPSLAAAVVRQAAGGLAAAHRAGIVHRDIKPSNLLMTDEGVVKVADFGLAGRFEVVGEAGIASVVEGTPRYIAPELCLGHPPSPAGDVYALGMTWFALLAGSAAFAGKDSQEIFRKHLRAPVPDIAQIRPDVPPVHAALIAQCLAKLPEDRFESAEQVVQALDAIKRGYGYGDQASVAMMEAASLRDLVVASRAARIDVREAASVKTQVMAVIEKGSRLPSLMVPVAAWIVLAVLIVAGLLVMWRLLWP